MWPRTRRTRRPRVFLVPFHLNTDLYQLPWCGCNAEEAAATPGPVNRRTCKTPILNVRQRTDTLAAKLNYPSQLAADRPLPAHKRDTPP